MNELDKLTERLANLSGTQRELLGARIMQLTATRERQNNRPANRLIAWIEGAGGATVDVKDLQSHAEVRLPAYMVPSRFIAVDRIPTLPNGKIDRSALKQLRVPMDSKKTDRTIAGPVSPDEQVLVDIWCEVLGLDEVGVDEDFFELGGDSLLSIRILARAQREGLEISPEAFFAEPSIRGQAAAAVSSAANTKEAEIPSANSAATLTTLNEKDLDTVAQTLAALDDLDD